MIVSAIGSRFWRGRRNTFTTINHCSGREMDGHYMKCMVSEYLHKSEYAVGLECIEYINNY